MGKFRGRAERQNSGSVARTLLADRNMNKVMNLFQIMALPIWKNPEKLTTGDSGEIICIFDDVICLIYDDQIWYLSASGRFSPFRGDVDDFEVIMRSA